MALSASKWGLQVLSKTRPVKAVNTDWSVGKYKNQLPYIQADAHPVQKKLWKVDYVGRQYCKIGTLEDDQMSEKHEVVKEARRRMTFDEQQARVFRVNRSHILSANQQILPEDQWTPMDADHNYMNQYLHEARNEITERKLVKCATLDFEGQIDRVCMIPYRIWNYLAIRKMRNTLKKELIAPSLY